jgi:RimJ/RimL family protein N-acetyltransferase
MIGVLCLNNDMSEPYHRATEMQVDILPEYQNKGYGSEAINWVMDWAFKTGGLHRVAVECYGYNFGAARLYRRLGFVEEGKKRDFTWHEGQWYDLLLFSLLEGDWKKLKVAQTAKTAMEKALASVENGVDEMTKEFEKRNYYNC